jgi:hypothetical protein
MKHHVLNFSSASDTTEVGLGVERLKSLTTKSSPSHLCVTSCGLSI